MILFSENLGICILCYYSVSEKDVATSFELKPEPLKNSSWISCVSVFQGNWSHRILHTIEIEIYYKKLTHTTVEADKSEICRASQQVGWGLREAGDPWRADAAGRIWSHPKADLPFPGEWVFSLRASNWWDEAHPHYGGQSVLFKVSWL